MSTGGWGDEARKAQRKKQGNKRKTIVPCGPALLTALIQTAPWLLPPAARRRPFSRASVHGLVENEVVYHIQPNLFLMILS